MHSSNRQNACKINNDNQNDGYNAPSAVVSDIKRFAVHDGDGIRTTVFLKGCYLRCKWCHNPEGLSKEPLLAYYSHKCINCGACVKVCPEKAHTMSGGIHHYDRSRCNACGLCEGVCPSDTLKLYGRVMSVAELLPILLEDRRFYENTGGGVTLSGGDPLCQPEFCAELFRALKEENINTALDTSGFAPREALDKVISYTDMFLYDMKAYDGEVHEFCTGVNNSAILENLKYLDERGCAIKIRIPYIPQMNDSQIKEIGTFISGLKNVKEVRILPYHAFSNSKYEALGMKYPIPDIPMPDAEEIKQAEEVLQKAVAAGKN